MQMGQTCCSREGAPTNLQPFRCLRRGPTPAGADLLPVVRIVDEFGTGYLRSLAKRITPEAQADYVISTVHRAKGLEWKRVKVINDFLFKYVDGRLTVEEDELRLLYVAFTRAQHVLDVSHLRDALLRLFRS